jgi:hypothetical protein
MTTTVTIDAHCSSDKEVKISVTEAGKEVDQYTIQDCETVSTVVYDDRVLSVKETEKE